MSNLGWVWLGWKRTGGKSLVWTLDHGDPSVTIYIQRFLCFPAETLSESRYLPRVSAGHRCVTNIKIDGGAAVDGMQIWQERGHEGVTLDDGELELDLEPDPLVDLAVNVANDVERLRKGYIRFRAEYFKLRKVLQALVTAKEQEIFSLRTQLGALQDFGIYPPNQAPSQPQPNASYPL